MTIRHLALLLGFVLSTPVLAQPVAKPACDRRCLEGYVDRYLDAICQITITGQKKPQDNFV